MDPETLIKIQTFVKQSTSHFDESHDYYHAEKVAYNTTVILQSKLLPITMQKVALIVAWLHDVCDYKYPESIKKEQLIEFIDSIMPEEKDNIFQIINNISWSKERRCEREKFKFPYQLILVIVSDADRLEAIGKVGMERCIAFGKAKKPGMDKVAEHCVDKLLRLLPENYIKTSKGRELAIPLHEYVQGWYDGYMAHN